MAGLLGVVATGFPFSLSLHGNERGSVPGTARSSDYTLDGTLEPDEIPGRHLMRHNLMQGVVADATEQEDNAYAPDQETLDVEGPVRVAVRPANPGTAKSFENEIAGLVDSTRTPLSKDMPIQPPPRVRGDMTPDEAEKKFALVQYRSRSRIVQQEQEFKPAHVQTPSAREIDSMPEGDQRDALKKSIRKVLAANSRRAITTQHNAPGDILMMALPYGADAKVYQPNPQADPRDKSTPRGSYIYSIGTLCWNYSCDGKTLLRHSGSRIYARVGAGYQKRPASFLALLAMSNIMPNYEMKVGGNEYSIGHLVASEKASVSKGMNLSMALVGLSFYGESDEKWKNEMGEIWSIERMVTEELNRSIDQGASDVTDWLLGLTSAVKLYEEEGKAIRGPLALAKRQLGTYHDFVLSIQNENYLWHPRFFLFKGSSPDAYETMYSSGHILRWLLLSVSDKKLEDPRISRAVASLASTVSRVPTNITAGTMSDRQLESLAVSLHALSIYNQRVFGDEPDAEDRKEEAAPEAKPEKSIAKR